MDIPIELPLDSEGYLRRECPTCEREFKWFHGRTEGTPEDWQDPQSYFCPYCGHSADGDSWFTKDQIGYVEQLALGHMSDEVDDMMKKTFKKQSTGLIQFDYKSGPRPSAPPVLSEPPDMDAVASPCHPFEPIKVLEGWDGPLHCLVCGEAFVV